MSGMATRSARRVEYPPAWPALDDRPDRGLLERNDDVAWGVVRLGPQPISLPGVRLADRLALRDSRVVQELAHLQETTLRVVCRPVVQMTQQREALDTDEQLAQLDIAAHARKLPTPPGS